MTITFGLILYALIAVCSVVIGRAIGWLLAWCIGHIKPIREWRKK